MKRERASSPSARQPSGQRRACKLHVVATPIGNLGDITVRAIEVLKSATVIAAEDTRVTRKLLTAYSIATPLVAFHEHNSAEMIPGLLARLERGESVALVSDAGTPLLSDPGAALITAVLNAGFEVEPLPGASALLAALVGAGLPADRFVFAGFLPPKREARRDAIAELAAIPATLVFYESPQRLPDMLADLAELLPARSGVVARELTKLHEEYQRGSLAELAKHYHTPPRGEVVVLVAPPTRESGKEVNIVGLLEIELKERSLRDAVAIVTAQTGRSKRDVYAEAVRLTRDEKKDI